MSKLSHVLGAVFGRPWYARPEILEVVAQIASAHAYGVGFTDKQIAKRVKAAQAGNGPRAGGKHTGNVAVIPIYGAIMPRATLMSAMSGGTSVESIREQFRAAMADHEVGSVLLEFDSPGGSVDGVDELATEIRDARGTKPIVAISNYGMASAAYYLGSQADEVVASPSAEVGWIGTYTVHQDRSRALEDAGITTTIIRNPPGKAGGNPYEPLSDQARAEMQDSIDAYTEMFVSAVAKGRGVTPATVRSDFGQGGGMNAKAARAAGLVDRVATLDDTLARMEGGRVSMRTVADAVTPEPEAPASKPRNRNAAIARALLRG